MQGVFLFVLLALALVLLIPLLPVAVPIIVVVAIIRAIGGSSRRNRTTDPAETRMIQEIHRGLTAMEKRIDNLETIMVEREREARRGETRAHARNGG